MKILLRPDLSDVSKRDNYSFLKLLLPRTWDKIISILNDPKNEKPPGQVVGEVMKER